MDYVINKGIAGLGNRLQSLGWALDVALEHDAQLVVDWRDTTWRSAFEQYFWLSSVERTPIEDVPEDVKIAPAKWAETWRLQAGTPGAKAMTYLINTDCDAHVICIYNHGYSDELCKRLRPSGQVRRETLRLKPEKQYNAYHIRHTDKHTDGWQAWLKLAQCEQETTGTRALIVTDNIHVQTAAAYLGLYSPSYLLPLNGRGGVHHVQCDSETKRRLNLSAVADMWLCIEAETFTACCPHSSYSQFIERMRKFRSNA